MIGIDQVVRVVIYLIVVAAIFGLLWYLVDYCVTKEPFRKFAFGFLMVCGVLLLINLLLGFVGTPIIRF